MLFDVPPRSARVQRVLSQQVFDVNYAILLQLLAQPGPPGPPNDAWSVPANVWFLLIALIAAIFLLGGVIMVITFGKLWFQA